MGEHMYRALDLSDERGLFCGHILGELGTEVIHVEAPGAPDRSPTWQAYTRGHRSVVLDLRSADGQQRFLDLAAGVDLLIESADPGTWEELGLGYDALATRNPALVWVSITPFGPDGPKAGYAATDLTVQAASGTMAICGSPDRAPLRTAGITAWSHAGAEAAGGALIALAEAQRSGRGQRVEVSAQRANNLAAFFTLQGERVGHHRLRRDGGGFTLVGVNIPFVWPVADGFVSLTVALDPVNKPFLERLLAFMREDQPSEWVERWDELLSRDWTKHLRRIRDKNDDGATPADLERLRDMVGEFLETRTKAELLAAALDRRLLLVPVSTIEDSLESPQLAHREFWRTETLADGTDARLPSHVVLGTESIPRSSGPPPAPGADTDAVLDEMIAWTPNAAAGAATGEETSRALEGLKVLDFMWVMAGPTATGVLAQYGATVVRVENAARLDGIRLLNPYFGGRAGRETSLAFASINNSKLSVTLDPNHEAAREVIHDLVRWADVVTESFSPRAMREWGLDYESLRRIKPDLIMMSSCLFGQDGPYAYMAGYGTMGAAFGGIVQPTGWPDRPPAGPYGAYTDVCAPRLSVASLLAALEHRRRTGEGTHIDQSQIETSLHYLLPAIVDHQVNGTQWDRMGNDDADMAPHAVYAAAGDDEWLAIACRDRADWLALCAVIGRQDWAADDRFSTAESRREAAAEIDGAIEAWTSQRSPGDGESALQAAGVPAHAVVHASAPEDAQLAHARHTVIAPHDGQDDRLVERTRIDLTRTPPEVTHVPRLGEHTEHVLTDILGYDSARIDELRRSGALGGEPNRS